MSLQQRLRSRPCNSLDVSTAPVVCLLCVHYFSCMRSLLPHSGSWLWRRYEDQGRVRPIIHRASTVEIIVPYGDPRAPFHKKCAFDVVVSPCSVLPCLYGATSPACFLAHADVLLKSLDFPCSRS